jgi:hypothetical protein
MFEVALCPSKYKTASVLYLYSVKEPIFQISADMFRKHQNYSKIKFFVVACPSKSKMAKVPYSGTAKEPTYQNLAHLVKKFRSYAKNGIFCMKNIWNWHFQWL